MNTITFTSSIALISVYVLALGVQAICCNMAMRKKKMILTGNKKNETLIMAQTPPDIQMHADRSFNVVAR